MISFAQQCRVTVLIRKLPHVAGAFVVGANDELKAGGAQYTVERLWAL